MVVVARPKWLAVRPHSGQRLCASRSLRLLTFSLSCCTVTMLDLLQTLYSSFALPTSHWLRHTLPILSQIGTGLSEGSVTIKDQVDLAKQFYGFLANIRSVFPDVAELDLTFNGVSYAGQFIPHIADYIWNQTDSLRLKNIGVIDGTSVE